LTVFKYALIRGLKSPAALISNFLAPLTLIFVSGMWVIDDSLGSGFFVVAGLMMFGSLFAARGIFNDKTDGTIVRILSGPISTFGYLAQNLLACMVIMAAQITIIVLIGTLLYGWGITLALALILCYTMFAGACVAFAFAWSCLFKTREVIVSVFTAIAMLMGFFGGLLLPLSLLPRPLYFSGTIFPTHWAARAIIELLTTGASLEYWLSLLALALFTMAFLLYGGKRRII